MDSPTLRQARALEALDVVFSQLGGESAPAPPVAPSAGATRRPPASPARGQEFDPQPPPASIPLTPQLQTAYEWLQREKSRLEGYTRAQLARIHSQREEMMRQSHNDEQAIILRAQELNRKEEFLAHQTKALQAHAAHVAQWENGLLGRLEENRKTQETLAEAQKTTEDVLQKIAGQRALLEALRFETSALQAARDAARADLAALEAALPAQREALEREQASLAAARAQVEQRLLGLDKDEAAMQRRLAELDDMEAQLREELEAQERQVSRERREIAEVRAKLRVRPLQTSWVTL
jgi:hypothetical protein